MAGSYPPENCPLNGHPPTVNARHDIGLVAAARLVAIFWAGLVPIVFPAWLVIRAEMRDQNIEQDRHTAVEFVRRAEFEERMKLLDERAKALAEVLNEIRVEQKDQRVMLQKIADKYRGIK